MASRSPFPTNNTNNASSNPAPRGPVPNSPFGRPGGDDDFLIDLSGVDADSTQGYIPEGQHPFYVQAITKETSKAGNPMLVWTLTVLDGPQAGTSKKVYTAITPNAMWKVYEMASAVGFPIPENGQFSLGALKAHAQDVIVTGDVIVEDYNGRPSSSVKAVYPPTHVEPGTKRPNPGVPR